MFWAIFLASDLAVGTFVFGYLNALRIYKLRYGFGKIQTVPEILAISYLALFAGLAITFIFSAQYGWKGWTLREYSEPSQAPTTLSKPDWDEFEAIEGASELEADVDYEFVTEI